MKREFAGHAFERVGLIDPERDASGAVREFMPQSRYANARGLPLNGHGAGPFCRFSIAQGLDTPGVYVLTLGDEAEEVRAFKPEALPWDELGFDSTRAALRAYVQRFFPRVRVPR